MTIAGHVSRQMLSRYSHVRNEAKRKALKDIYAGQTSAEAATRKRIGAQAQAQQDTATSANAAQTLPVHWIHGLADSAAPLTSG